MKNLLENYDASSCADKLSTSKKAPNNSANYMSNDQTKQHSIIPYHKSKSRAGHVFAFKLWPY